MGIIDAWVLGILGGCLYAGIWVILRKIVEAWNG